MPPRVSRDRNGSTLLIVMVLLGMLSLVGFLFYTFAASERSAAAYFADANKYFTPDFDADTLVEFGLQQLIVGPDASQTQSALYGGRHSLIPNIFGRDIYTYNGAGIHLGSVDFNPYPAAPNALTDGNAPFVDMNHDGVADTVSAATPLGQYPLEFNDSAQAHGGSYPRNLFNDAANPNPVQVMPDPGVDYTYPDINNLFLAYKGYAIDPSGDTVQVIIPSFHRPQLLRYDASAASPGKPVSDWYQNPSFAGRILRPHIAHLNPNGNPRFPQTPTGTLTSVFPFMQGVGGYQGVWSRTFRGDTVNYAYEYDVDNDGDGIKEGVWLDLGHPVQTSADGRRYVPLFSFTVYDADGLFNLNVHGNHAHASQLTTLGDLAFNSGAGTALPVNSSGTTRFLSGSNQGLTPFEVNPQYAFYTDPSNPANYTGNLDQYTYQFGISPANAIQAANMDWWRLVAGSANFQSPNTFNDLYAGRNGDANTWLFGGFTQGITSASNAIYASPVNQMPKPGQTQVDDNWNQYEGQFAWDSRSSTPGVSAPASVLTYTPTDPSPSVSRFSPFFPTQLQYYANYPFGNPLDFNADGTISQPGQFGKVRYFTTNASAPYNSMKYQQFVGFDNHGVSGVPGNLDPNTFDSVAAAWRPDSLQGQQMVDRNGNQLITQPATSQIDEEHELIAEPGSATKYDTILRDDEMAGLHLELNDRTNLSLSSRPRTLAPLNLNQSSRADLIAKRFTTSSYDRRGFGTAGLAGDLSYASRLLLPASPQTFNPLNLPAASTVVSPVNCFGDDVVCRPWEFSDLMDAGSNSYYDQGGPVSYEGLRETFPPAVFSYRYYDSSTSSYVDRQVYLKSTDVNLSSLHRSLDPFRPPVRKLLEVKSGNRTDPQMKQFRLSLNHLTTTDGVSDYFGNVIQRSFTPHDASLTDAPATSAQEIRARLDRQQMARDIYVMLYMFGGGVDYATQNGHVVGRNVGAQGYTGDNNSAENSGTRSLYSDRQLRQMAQFAVNVVDALDADNVMTKFEYDKNLGNGWGYVDLSIALDDNPYTDDYAAEYNNDDAVKPYVLFPSGNWRYDKADPAYPEDSDERGVVYGVESQEMTFNEVLAFKCPMMEMPAGTPYNHAATEHNDGVERYFSYVELRNIGVGNIDLSDRAWRVRVVSKNNKDAATAVLPNSQRVVNFQGGVVASGDTFTFGNAGETDGASITSPNHSKYRCDNTQFDNPTVGAPFDPNDQRAWIAPPPNAEVIANAGNLNLDLIADRDPSSTSPYKSFQVIDLGTTPNNVTDDTDVTADSTGTVGSGRFFNRNTLVDPDTPLQEKPKFILERRQYPNRPFPGITDQAGNSDNPWIPVDEFELPVLVESTLDPMDTTRSAYDSKLQILTSRERDEPLKRAATSHAGAIVSNSLMTRNSNAPAVGNNFGLWQTTYDRPFASPVELLYVSLESPHNLSRSFSVAGLTPLGQTKAMKTIYDADLALATAAMTPDLQLLRTLGAIPHAPTAGGLFLQPQDVENIAEAPADKLPAKDNRWYRFFEFFEVPTAMHRQLGNPLENVRVPGKINLNNVRYAEVLAGLLDDLDVVNVTGLDTNQPALNATDFGDADSIMSSGVRDWWVQFLKARDGRRTTAAGDNDVNNNPIVRMNPDNVTGLFLPGLADSSPFRSFASLGFTRSATFAAPETALDQTLFRRLPIDMANQAVSGDPVTDPTFDTRHLWEVGVPNHATNVVDPIMRDRLLAKIFNNTTTRSHVFYVFVSVQFFEADDTTFTAADPRNVIIGGPLASEPEYRGFFVIDRSKPEDAYDGVSGRFTNYRSMIKYRLRIE